MRAIGSIATPFALDFFFKAALEDEDFNNWGVLSQIEDKRIISLALRKYDMKNQQNGFSIIKSFMNIGTEEVIPYLSWLLITKDRSVQRFVIEAMEELGSEKGIKPLKSYLMHPNADSLNFLIAKDAIQTLSTRSNDGIWAPYPLTSKEKNDLISMYHEMTFDGDNFDYLFKYKPEFRSFFMKIGKKGLPVLREKFSNLAHTDGTKTWFYESENVAKLMVEIGSESIPYFIDALNDMHYHVREISSQSLNQLTEKSFGLDYKKWKDWYLKIK